MMRKGIKRNSRFRDKIRSIVRYEVRGTVQVHVGSASARSVDIDRVQLETLVDHPYTKLPVPSSGKVK